MLRRINISIAGYSFGNNRDMNDHKKIRFLKQYEKFLEDYRYGRMNKKYSNHTISSYLYAAGLFYDICGIPSREITQEEIDRFVGILREKKVSATGFNQRMAGFEKLAEYLTTFNINISGRFPRKPVQNQQYVDTFTTAEMNKIIRTIRQGNDIRALSIIMAFITTGIRVSELLQITIHDVWTDSFKVLGKGEKEREIFWMPDDVYDLWKQYLKIRKSTDPLRLFTGERGALTRQTVNNILKYWVGKARGLKKSKARAHNFRHYFGKWMDEQGYSLSEIASYLGHSSVDTSKIYTQRTRNELRKKMKSSLRERFADEKAEQRSVKRKKNKKTRNRRKK